MRLFRVLLLSFSVASASAVSAATLDLAPAPGALGLGLVVGEPTGISVAYSLDKENAVQGSLAWKLANPGGFVATGDYLFRFENLLAIQGVAVPLYAGGGLKAIYLSGDERYGDSSSVFGLGLRFPVGARWLFKELPAEAFVELAPGMLLFPETRFDISAGIGARWYF